MRIPAAWAAALTRPFDAASLAVFRVVFGLTMVGELVQAFLLGRIETNYEAPTLLFPYYGFGWLGRLHEPWLTPFFAGLLGLAVLVTVGAFYRVASVLLFLGYTYTFVLDQTNYQNHLYLICLFALLLSCVDAHRAFSVDARRRSLAPVVPGWQIALFAFQVGVVYFFGAVNKLSGEWLSGAPMALNLDEVRHIAWLSPYLDEPWSAKLFAWGGLLVDLVAVPGLLVPRARRLTFVVLVLFHAMNAMMFSIGVFPWLMLGATTIFFPPAWPRRWLRRLRSLPEPSGMSSFPELGRAHRVLLVTYVALQLLVPLRRHLYPGNSAWTGDGTYFAWTMKLHLRSGSAHLFVAEPGAEFVEAPLYAFLTAKQIRHLAYTPQMILRVSQYVQRVLPAGHRFKWVTALSLNGRPAQPYTIEDGATIARQRATLGPTRFLMPLQTQHPPTPAELASLRARSLKQRKPKSGPLHASS